ncbi:hypothetical protein AXXA_07700 [Achromobacter insuavis AXX-A]|uniref:Uncharacterized protein n=1 Tax=Achromobacter insuavis AXX-A TaxID=1003200 RepID=F7SXZ2_9BURK|nr:hypothetical protein AXXA_07700 [Achromobacter insuavis AXX-A]
MSHRLRDGAAGPGGEATDDAATDMANLGRGTSIPCGWMDDAITGAPGPRFK